MARSPEATAASRIRKELKTICANKFRVTSKTSGTSSIRIAMTDESPEVCEKVQQIAHPYQHGSFDSSNDLYSYNYDYDKTANARYVIVNNYMSESMRKEILQWLGKVFDGPADYQNVYHTFIGQQSFHMRFWNSRNS